MKLPGESRRKRGGRAVEAVGFESEERPGGELERYLKRAAAVQLERGPMKNGSGTFDLGWAAVVLGDSIRTKAVDRKEDYLNKSYKYSWPVEYLVLLSWIYPEERAHLRDYPSAVWVERQSKNQVLQIEQAFDLYILYTGIKEEQNIFFKKMRLWMVGWLAELKVKDPKSFLTDTLFIVPKVLLVFPELRPVLFKLLEPGLEEARGRINELSVEARIGLAMLTGEIFLKLNEQGVPEVEPDTTLTKLTKKIELPERPTI